MSGSKLQLTLGDYSMVGADMEGPYRYRLWRDWRPQPIRVCWVMLNPSTADGVEDDPTIRRCMGFTKEWGYGGLVVVNLFALRATDPEDLALHVEPIGRRNDEEIQRAVSESPITVIAWGSFAKSVKAHRDRDERVLALIREASKEEPFCIGRTNGGFPRHPLYMPGECKPVRFSEAAS